ncbi:MAG: PHB depolymerase family esterase [Polaromonas sp.]|nr:PHB depolymerase family esterase [Polaromonas sp.]
MLKATQLTNMGKLLDATRLIQRALLSAVPPAQPTARREPAPAANDPRVDEVPPQVIILPPPARDRAAPLPGRKASRAASFTQHPFVFEADTYPYRLYIPSAPAADVGEAKRMPLIVLLHGCKQAALDFSHGTAMNTLAEEHQVMVLYPEQITNANAMRCWNWFEPGHQQAERGEPGMIAALTQKILQQHDGDPQRVYIAGLSAGGAMAAVMGGLHPDIFAALGVHSGLAAGAAQDVMSAFGAMRSGAKGRAASVIPTIVFHGTADKTVHPDNADHITDAALEALKASGLKLVKTKSPDSNNRDDKTERVIYSTEDGTPYIENWRIDGSPHAWSGGDAAGSYTDPDGPSASAAMLAFFLQHRLRPA